MSQSDQPSPLPQSQVEFVGSLVATISSLRSTLSERDRTIETLRKLLAEKDAIIAKLTKEDENVDKDNDDDDEDEDEEEGVEGAFEAGRSREIDDHSGVSRGAEDRPIDPKPSPATRPLIPTLNLAKLTLASSPATAAPAATAAPDAPSGSARAMQPLASPLRPLLPVQVSPRSLEEYRVIGRDRASSQSWRQSVLGQAEQIQRELGEDARKARPRPGTQASVAQRQLDAIAAATGRIRRQREIEAAKKAKGRVPPAASASSAAAGPAGGARSHRGPPPARPATAPAAAAAAAAERARTSIPLSARPSTRPTLLSLSARGERPQPQTARR